MDVSTVTDSTDWLDTPLAGLAPLESSIRCQVCKEVLNTPMITSCSHTFCSLCIRRYLSQEGKCPSCRLPDQEMKLRHNYAVEELVSIWSEKRAEIYNFAKNASLRQDRGQEEERPKKRRRLGGDAVVVQKSGLEERRSTRSQSRRTVSSTSGAAGQTLPSTQEEVVDSDAGSEYHESPRIDTKHFPPAPTEPHDGLVACPNCNRRLREALINAHLDKCLQGLASPTPPPPQQPSSHVDRLPDSSPQIQTGTIAYTLSKLTGTASQRLPTMNYSLLNEQAMRKKLRELGIPNQGSKEVMRKRHGEWMNLWNANCDSLQPVGKAKLLQELNAWERNLGKDERQRQTGGANRVMEKEFDREGHMKRNGDDFADLIRKARESRQQKMSVATEPGGTANPATEPSNPVADPSPATHASDMQMMDVSGPVQPAPEATETLVPSTPPRLAPQVNGDHVPPPPPPPPQDAIDLTTPEKQRSNEQHDPSQPEWRLGQIV